jgi:hypothetical protein
LGATRVSLDKLHLTLRLRPREGGWEEDAAVASVVVEVLGVALTKQDDALDGWPHDQLQPGTLVCKRLSVASLLVAWTSACPPQANTPQPPSPPLAHQPAQGSPAEREVGVTEVLRIKGREQEVGMGGEEAEAIQVAVQYREASKAFFPTVMVSATIQHLYLHASSALLVQMASVAASLSRSRRCPCPPPQPPFSHTGVGGMWCGVVQGAGVRGRAGSLYGLHLP